MEQLTYTTIASGAVDRWAGAVLKLMELTRTGKLKWDRNILETDSHFLGLPLTVTMGGREPQSVRYTTHLDGNTFVLTVPVFNPARQSLVESLGYPQPAAGGVTLKVLQSNGGGLVDVPKLSILRGLAAAVEGQISSEEEAILSTIEKAAV